MTELKRNNHQNFERRARPWKFAKFEKQVDIDCPNVICDLRIDPYQGEPVVSRTVDIASKMQVTVAGLAICVGHGRASVTGGG